MKRKLSEVREDHSPRFVRRQLGLSAISGRPVYGYTVICACGWRRQTNEKKPAAKQHWAWHVREEWSKECKE